MPFVSLISGYAFTSIKYGSKSVFNIKSYPKIIKFLYMIV